MNASIFSKRNKTFAPFTILPILRICTIFFHSIPVHCSEKRELYSIQCLFRLIYNRLDYSKGNNYSADAAAAAETTIHKRITKSENLCAACMHSMESTEKFPFPIRFILK